MLLVGRPAPVNRNRNEQQFLTIRSDAGIHQALESRRSLRARTAQDKTAFPTQDDRTTCLLNITKLQVTRWRRQSVYLAQTFERERVRKTAMFENVANRCVLASE